MNKENVSPNVSPVQKNAYLCLELNEAKMATTFSLEIKKAPTSKGKYPVFIRITKDRKHKRIRTSVELSRLADWNPKGAKNQNWVRTSERNAEKLNDALAKELDEVKELYRENKGASLEQLAIQVKEQGTSPSFLDYAKAQTDELEALGRSNAKHYRTFCNKFEAFLSSVGRTDITFKELSPAVITDFESFLNKETNGKIKAKDKEEARRLHPNYVRTLLVKFRALVNKAIRDGLMPGDLYPFKAHPIPKEIESSKEALDESEIEAIKALEYEVGSWLWNTKNAFLFSFYCAGIRAGDLLQLRWRNIKEEGTRLEYVMGKNHKQRNYPIVAQAGAILALYRSEDSKPSDYIFPLLDSTERYAKETDVDTMPVALKKELFNQIYSKNTLLNKYLKKIAVDAGIEKRLSFHISRHSFASLARERALPSKVVQEALAHSSLTTTERYMHQFGIEEVGNALQKVFDTRESRQEALLEALKGLDKGELTELLDRLKKGN